MWFSPEMQRNLWLQLSWSRLLSAPVFASMVLAALLAGLKPQPISLSEGARWAFVLIIAFWGTRRVADSLAEELADGTWESQRMSGQGAWSMIWGKMAGGAAFPWYCALIALGIMIWYGLRVLPETMRLPLWQQVITLMLGAILALSVSLAVALLLLRKSHHRRRLSVTLAQVGGLAAFIVATIGDYSASPWATSSGTISWFGRVFDSWQFHTVSTAIFVLWSLLACYRLMRAELLYRNHPWLWLLFVAFVMAYVAGFFLLPVETLSAQLLAACYAGLGLTYLSFFAELKDPVRYRWGLARFTALQWWRALEFTPWWLVAYLMTCGVGAAAIWSVVMGGGFSGENTWWFPWFQWAHWFAVGSVTYKIAALLLFALRDILFLLWFNFGPMRQRADVSGFVLLVFAYGPLAWVVYFSGFSRFLPALVPLAAANPADLAWPAAEVLAMALLLHLRWRQTTRVEVVADDREEPSIGAP